MASKEKSKAKATSSEDVSSVDVGVRGSTDVAASESSGTASGSSRVSGASMAAAPRLSDISAMLNVPEFKEGHGEVPREWLRKVERMRNSARAMFNESTMVDSVLWTKLEAKFGGMVAAWFDQWQSNNSGRESWTNFKASFEAKYISAEKLMQWRNDLHERSMKADETPEQYVEALRVLQRMVGCSDDEIRTRFLFGLPRGLRTKVEMFELVDLDAAARKAQAIYKSEKNTTENEVKMTTRMNREEIICRRCGGKGHIERYCSTRVKGQQKQVGRRFDRNERDQGGEKRVITCYNCGNTGHMAKDCRSKRKTKTVRNTVRMTKVKDESESEDEVEEKEEAERKTKVHLASGGERFQLVRGVVKVGDAAIEALIDSGANTTLIREDQLKSIGKWKKIDFKEVVRGIGGVADIRFWIKVVIGLGGKMTEVIAAVMDSDFDEKVLLGLDVLIPLKTNMDLEKMEMNAKGGKRVKLTGKSDSRKYYVVAAKAERLVPGKIKWIVGNVETEGKEKLDAYVDAIGEKIDVPSGVYAAKDGEIELPVMNREETEVNVKRGDRIAQWQAMEMQSKKPETKQPERKLLTDEEIEKCATPNLTQGQREKLVKVLKKHRKVFIREDEAPDELNIEPQKLKVEGEPIAVGSRPWTMEQRKVAEAETEKMRKWNITRESRSPYRAELVFVPKKNGSVRPCVDYRQVNKKMQFDAYPMPRIDEELNKFGGCKIFSEVDISKAYWHIPLDEESKKITAFRSPNGLEEFNRLPFGIKNAGAIFCRVVRETVLEKLKENVAKRVANYIDEFLLGEVTFEEHIEQLDEFLGVLEESGWRLSLEKCEFCKTEVTWVGHRVGENGIRPTVDRVAAILNAKEPESVSEVRRILGMMNQYRYFIRDMAEIAEPLYALTKKGVAFEFGERERKSWNELKGRLTRQPVLKVAELDKPMELSVDASKTSIGAVLEQDKRPIAYFSRSLNEAERKYATTDKEWLAILFGLEASEIYLGKLVTTVWTDHESLQSLDKIAAEDATGRRWRWLERLARFKFEVKARPGKENVVADALSRKPFAAMVGVGPVEMTKEQWRALQNEDHSLDEYFDYLEKKVVPASEKEARRVVAEANNLVVEGGVLYHLWTPHRHAPRKDAIKQVVVPFNEQGKVLKGLHEHSMAGHMGTMTTYNRIRERYWWPNLYRDVVDWTKTCKTCESMRRVENDSGLLEPTFKENLNGRKRWAMDVAGPFEESERGNKYILVAVDYDDGWPEVFEIKDQKTETIMVPIKRDIIARFGVPDEILTDRGSSLISELATAIYSDLGLEKLTTTAYNPQADGAAESMVKKVKKILAALVAENKKKWDELLPDALMALRSSWKRDTRMSPYELKFGSKMKLPIHLELPIGQEKTLSAAERKKTMELVRKIEDEETKKEQARYDRGRIQDEYKENDLVWLRNDGAKSLQMKWIGPFEIEKKISKLNYQIKEFGNSKLNGRHPIVNVKRLKLYRSRGDEEWEPEWKVDEILDHKKLRNKKFEFKVKWNGGAETWEPFENLVDEEEGEIVYNEKLEEYIKSKKIKELFREGGGVL